MVRYADGDESAFRPLYEAVGPRVKMFLLRLGASAPLADDLVQESFLRLHRARGHFQRGAAVLPWVFSIARNAFVDSARKRKTDKSSLVRSEDEERAVSIQSAEAPKAEGTAIARQTLERVQQAMARLPEAQREAFVLVRFEGLSMDEAARVVGTTEGALKVRAFRAHEALKKMLAEEGGDA